MEFDRRSQHVHHKPFNPNLFKWQLHFLRQMKTSPKNHQIQILKSWILNSNPDEKTLESLSDTRILLPRSRFLVGTAKTTTEKQPRHKSRRLSKNLGFHIPVCKRSKIPNLLAQNARGSD